MKLNYPISNVCDEYQSLVNPKFQDEYGVKCRCPDKMNMFTRLGGLFGALAVALNAYGAHVLKPQGEFANVYHTASLQHFLHTIALFLISYSRFPNVTGALFSMGMIMFCGSCYYYAITEDASHLMFTPYGGMTLMFAWASFIL